MEHGHAVGFIVLSAENIKEYLKAKKKNIPPPPMLMSSCIYCDVHFAFVDSSSDFTCILFSAISSIQRRDNINRPTENCVSSLKAAYMKKINLKTGAYLRRIKT